MMGDKKATTRLLITLSLVFALFPEIKAAIESAKTFAQEMFETEDVIKTLQKPIFQISIPNDITVKQFSLFIKNFLKKVSEKKLKPKKEQSTYNILPDFLIKSYDFVRNKMFKLTETVKGYFTT